MTQTTPIRFARPKNPEIPPISGTEKVIAAGLIGMSMFLVGVVLGFLLLQLVFLGRVFPGVSIAGIDLGGMTRLDAEKALISTNSFANLGRLSLTDGTDTWVVAPVSMGLTLDVASTAEQALSVGRSGNPLNMLNDVLNTLQVGIVLPPVIQFDQVKAASELLKIDDQIKSAPQEASLLINGSEVVYTPGRSGSGIDIDASLAYITAQMQLFRDGEVKLVVRPVEPMVLDASASADIARNLLANGLTLRLAQQNETDPGPWTLSSNELAGMIRFVRSSTNAGSTYLVSLDTDLLRQTLERISQEVNRGERDARFTFDAVNASLILTEKAHNGYQLNVTESIAQIQADVAAGKNDLSLVVKVTQPQLTDTVTAEQLGITQLIQSQTTYFYGSSGDRRTNIKTAAANFNGVLVPPDSVFSMGKYMSDVTLENGYAEALIIFNGKTIKGVGGGVCQVSTTLFRTAFYAGFPIKERHAHAYRVFYYEQGPGGRNDPSLSGFDATVYFPLVDFKFQNDTPYWILMETVYDEATSSLTWNFYSTPDGRTVQANFSGPTDVKPALPPVITFNPDAEAYSLTHLDYASEGAKIIIDRSVTKNGALWFADSFITEYQPWAEACEYGPQVDDVERALRKKGWCQPIE